MSNPERVSNIEPFINRYNWDRIKCISKLEYWKKSDSNNPTIALNVLHEKEMEKCSASSSKYDSTFQKQIILLMIPNVERKGWHYLAVKKLFVLLYGITSKHKGDFYCLNCLHSFRTKNKLKSH